MAKAIAVPRPLAMDFMSSLRELLIIQRERDEPPSTLEFKVCMFSVIAAKCWVGSSDLLDGCLI
jgi:hypothetical protein